jgi:hypothetical protein
MTHWEYPQAVERFGRQLNALGIAAELERRGAVDGDLVMVDKFDFDFAPGRTNPYIPADLLEKDIEFETNNFSGGMLVEEPQWRPFKSGGYLDDDSDELLGFDDDEDWEILEDSELQEFEYMDDDDVWQS